MKIMLGIRHNLWRFIESLKSQEAGTKWLMVSNAAGLDLTNYPGILYIIKCIDNLSDAIYCTFSP